MNITNPRSSPDGVKQAAPAAKEKSFWALNWLRFVLAIYLVFFHTLLVYYRPIQDTWFASALGLGNLATSVFFVLSGFLLTHAYVVMKNGRDINKRNFLIARFSTLYPLHVVGLLLAIGPIAVTLFSRGGIPVAVAPFSSATRVLEQWEVLLALGMSLTLTNAWNPLYQVFNGPSWSLSALGFYYLLFPAIALKAYRMKSPRTALVVLGILFLIPGVTADLLHRSDLVTQGLLSTNPIIRLPLFVAGIVLSVMFARSTTSGTPKQWFLGGSLIVATVVLATILRHHDIRMHFMRNGLYYPASLAIIWLCACARPTRHERLRYWGDRLGAAALPLFLLHIPIFALFRKAEQVFTALPSAPGGVGSVMAAARDAEQSLLFYPLYLVVLVAICIVVQERFVTRLQKGIRNRFSDRGNAASAAVNGVGPQATGTR